VDDFEEIIIPDVKKNLAKTREFVKTATKPPTMSRKHRRVKKDDTNDKNIDENVIDYDKDNEMVEDPMEKSGEVNDDVVDNEDKALDSDDDDFNEPADKSNSDCETQEIPNDSEMPLSTKSNSDLSNVSSPASECKSVDDPFDEDYMESPETTRESQVTSASEAASDLSNEAVDVPAISTVSPDSLTQRGHDRHSEKIPNTKTSDVCADVISKPENISCHPGGSTPHVINEIHEEESKITTNEKCSNDLGPRIFANNLEVDEHGTSVIWTRYFKHGLVAQHTYVYIKELLATQDCSYCCSGLGPVVRSPFSLNGG
jgi:hypothetical protein